MSGTEAISGAGVVVIIRRSSVRGLDALVAAAIEGGARAVEVTMNTPGCLGWIESSAGRFGGDVLIGAGTVIDAHAARSAINAGARLIVAPGLDAEVVALARASGAVAMPGALTPTEVMAARRAGADLVKLFPAAVGGPDYLADLLAPLDDVPLVPVGRVDALNACSYIRAGAAAVAVGAGIVVDDPAETERRVREVVVAVEEARCGG